MRITGKIQRIDLGAGGWMLVADDGRRFQVTHPKLRDGQRVEVEGDVAASGVSFLMTAPVLEIRHLRDLG